MRVTYNLASKCGTAFTASLKALLGLSSAPEALFSHILLQAPDSCILITVVTTILSKTSYGISNLVD